MSEGSGELSPDPSLLRELYKIAIEEYRFTVSQNTDRQKFFVGLNVAVSSVVPTVYATRELEFGPLLPGFILILAALTAVLGVFVVERSHSNYRNARDHFKRIEMQLGLLGWGLGLSTTTGMHAGGREARRPTRIKVYRVVQLLLVGLAIFDVVAAVCIWSWS